MSADDQTFLDALNAVPRQMQGLANDVAEIIEAHIDHVAQVLKDNLNNTQWIPESVRPKPPPPPPAPVIFAPESLYGRVQDWVMKNKVITGTCVVGLGVSIYFIKRQRSLYLKKRRANRASNGARVEAVVVAGSITEPIVRSLALDLERRGFIVFVVCNDVEEELMVQSQERSDIRPLMIDLSEPHLASQSVDRLAQYLQSTHHAFQGARPHIINLNSVIVIPSLTYPTAPIATLAPRDLSDLLNTRLLQPILITQTLLPLLTSAGIHPLENHKPLPINQTPPSTPKILILTPTIIPSLNPAFHAPESLIISALSTFTQSLTSEVSPVGIPVTQIKLGAFDTLSLHPRNQLQTLDHPVTWPLSAREAYGGNFQRMTEKDRTGGGVKGSPLRELHNAVFDEMVRPNWRAGGVVRVGQGALIYELVGMWVPRGVLGWVMGLRTVSRPVSRASDSSVTSEGSVEGEGSSAGDGEYVRVHPKREAQA